MLYEVITSAIYHKASLCERLGKYGEAAEIYKNVGLETSSDAVSGFNRAVNLLWSGAYAEAVYALEIVVKKNPNEISAVITSYSIHYTKLYDIMVVAFFR